MVSSKSPNRRTVFLINRRFQLSFIGYMVAVSVATTLVFYFGTYLFFLKFRTLGAAAGLPADHAFFQFITEQQHVMNWGFLGVGSFAVILLVISGIKMSQRVAGPLYRLQSHMARVASGETTHPVQFREGDYFPELAEVYNRQLKTLKGSADNKAA